MDVIRAEREEDLIKSKSQYEIVNFWPRKGRGWRAL